MVVSVCKRREKDQAPRAIILYVSPMTWEWRRAMGFYYDDSRVEPWRKLDLIDASKTFWIDSRSRASSVAVCYVKNDQALVAHLFTLNLS